jgi:hypothetical protein
MAYTAFTGTVANVYPASFQAVYIKTGAEKWQTLGAISNADLSIKDFTSPDSLGRNKAINCYDFTAKCRMMQTSNVELKLLAKICDGSNSFLFKLSDAVTPAGAASAGWVAVTNAQVGCKAHLLADGAPDADRYTELDFQGSIFKSDANEVLLYTPTLAAADFASTATTGTYCGTSGVGGIGTYSATTDGGQPTNSALRPCGISTFTLDLAGASAPVTITPVTNVKFSLEMLAAVDGLRRFLPNSLNVNVELDWMATSSHDQLLLGNGSVVDIKAIVTFLDGTICTFDNQTGIGFNFKVPGDVDKNRVTGIALQGKTLQATITTIVT